MHQILGSFVVALPLCACSLPGPAPVRDHAVGQVHRPRPATRDSVTVCVVQDGELRSIEAEHDLTTGDTLVDGTPLGEAFPDSAPPYAGRAPWFIRRKPVTFQDRLYYWNSPQRVVTPEELRPVGMFQDIPLFAHNDLSAGLGILYIPVRRGCQFQPYYHFSGGPVRGS